jgi:hypothetical protein
VQTVPSDACPGARFWSILHAPTQPLPLSIRAIEDVVSCRRKLNLRHKVSLGDRDEDKTLSQPRASHISWPPICCDCAGLVV